MEKHNSRLGTDQFDRVIDLVNHIARYGLETVKSKDELDVSDKERLALEIFVAAVSTFDVW